MILSLQSESFGVRATNQIVIRNCQYLQRKFEFLFEIVNFVRRFLIHFNILAVVLLKIVPVFLAFQVLLSSMSFNLALHFCGDNLRSYSLFGAATPCEHSNNSKAAEVDKAPCPFHSQKKKSSKEDCCNDKQVRIEGQDIDTTVSSFNLDSFPQPEFIAVYTVSLLNLFQSEALNNKFRNYKPPLIQVDVPVFLQTFLI